MYFYLFLVVVVVVVVGGSSLEGHSCVLLRTFERTVCCMCLRFQVVP